MAKRLRKRRTTETKHTCWPNETGCLKEGTEPSKQMHAGSEQRVTVKQAAFLAAYAETGNIAVAAKIARVNRTTHYWWMEHSADYPARFEEARQEAVDVLEAEARRRAVDGVEKPVGWYKGKPGAIVREYSDVLLIFLLKGAAPEKYREFPAPIHRRGMGKANGSVDVGRQILANLAARLSQKGRKGGSGRQDEAGSVLGD